MFKIMLEKKKFLFFVFFFSKNYSKFFNVKLYWSLFFSGRQWTQTAKVREKCCANRGVISCCMRIANFCIVFSFFINFSHFFFFFLTFIKTNIIFYLLLPFLPSNLLFFFSFLTSHFPHSNALHKCFSWIL